MSDSTSPPPHSPGAISLFFVAKAALFAAGFWIWLIVLMARGGAATGVHLVAASGGIVTTLVSVVLGARLALQRNAAVRHAELKRLLVDISWNAFAAAGNGNDERGAKVVPFRGASLDAPTAHRSHGETNEFERRR